MNIRRGFFALLILIAGLVGTAPVSFAESTVPKVTTAQFKNDVLLSPLPTLIQFDATWCPFCRGMQPVMSALHREKSSDMNILRVDVDEEPDIAALYQVQTLPTMVIIYQGKEFARAKGAFTREQMFTWVDEMKEDIRKEPQTFTSGPFFAR